MKNVRHSRLPNEDDDKETHAHRPAEYSQDDAAGEQAMWVTGFWKRLPYLGIAALLAILLLMALVLYVLRASDKVVWSQWTFLGLDWQPQVWVAICSTLSGALLNFAFVEGLIIYFWNHAQAGTTGKRLLGLHDYCESAHALPARHTLLSRRVNAVAIACLLVTISFARNPLLQRASTLDTYDFRFDGSKTFRAAHDLDPQLLVSQLANGDVDVFLEPLLEGLRELRLGRGMTLPNVDCQGRCRTKVKAAGFKAECNSSTYDFTMLEDDAVAAARERGCLSFYQTGSATGANASEVTARCRAHGSFLNTPVFGITYDAVNTSGGGGGPVLTSRFKDSRDCRGVGQLRTCRLTPAVLEYDVDITNGSVTLVNSTATTATSSSSSSSSNSGAANEAAAAAVVALLPPPREPEAQRLAATTWARIAGSLFPPMTVEHRRWSARNASLRFVGQCDGRLGGNDSCAVGLGGFSGAMLLYREDKRPNSSDCELSFRDPMPDMIRSLLDISFRLSFITARSRDDDAQTANWTQTVPFTGVDARVVFTTHWAFGSAAVAVTLLAWAAVAPLYYGWWRLGRSMTLSPLEMAAAFDAPLLRRAGAVPPNANAELIVRRVGGVKVRYGVKTAAGVDRRGEGAGGELRRRFGSDRVEARVCRFELVDSDTEAGGAHADLL